MSERSIQDVFNDERNNDKIINEIKKDIENLKNKLQKELDNYIIKQKKLSKEKSLLMIDLIKEKKIKWIECDTEMWGKYVGDTGNFNTNYYNFYYNNKIYKNGYYEGYEFLNEKENNHFHEYINDYFFYGFPLYYDKNNKNGTKTDCEIAFSKSVAYYEIIKW